MTNRTESDDTIVSTIVDTYPVHLQGQAYLEYREHGKLPDLPALLRHYGRSNTVGRADIEKHDTTLLSRLYAVVALPVDQTPASELDASYATHCRLAKLVGEPVVRDLASGMALVDVCEVNHISRMTLHRAFKLLQSDV